MSSDSLFGEIEFSQPPSPSRALVVLPTDSEGEPSTEWRPILSDIRQVVLYNSASHAVTVRPHHAVPPALRGCPYCHRPLDPLREADQFDEEFDHLPTQHTRAPNYFQLLEISNETSSRPSSPGSTGRFRSDSSSSSNQQQSQRSTSDDRFQSSAMAEGYFNAFFKEEYRLGMGANGSVFLCQVFGPLRLRFNVFSWALSMFWMEIL